VRRDNGARAARAAAHPQRPGRLPCVTLASSMLGWFATLCSASPACLMRELCSALQPAGALVNRQAHHACALLARPQGRACGPAGSRAARLGTRLQPAPSRAAGAPAARAGPALILAYAAGARVRRARRARRLRRAALRVPRPAGRLPVLRARGLHAPGAARARAAPAPAPAAAQRGRRAVRDVHARPQAAAGRRGHGGRHGAPRRVRDRAAALFATSMLDPSCCWSTWTRRTP